MGSPADVKTGFWSSGWANLQLKQNSKVNGSHNAKPLSDCWWSVLLFDLLMSLFYWRQSPGAGMQLAMQYTALSTNNFCHARSGIYTQAMTLKGGCSLFAVVASACSQEVHARLGRSCRPWLPLTGLCLALCQSLLFCSNCWLLLFLESCLAVRLCRSRCKGDQRVLWLKRVSLCLC